MLEFPIIDSHVHLYDVDRLQYGWLANQPLLNLPHLLPEFEAAVAPFTVDGLVFAEVAVDPGLHVEEARFAQSLADQDKRVLGLVAHAPVELGAAVDAELDALSAFPALRGIRRLIETEADPSISLEPDFIEGVRRVGRRGLSFDLCVKHWALTFAVELARRCPDVVFVLDHLGKPGIRQGLQEPWRRQISELAAMPNVQCKVSGVLREAAAAQRTIADIAPYLDHAAACFGFDRLMYGSDWPVSKLTHAYPDWVTLLDTWSASCSADEREALFRRTAIRTYRLVVPPGSAGAAGQPRHDHP